MNNRVSNGFSLVEMIVVLALMGLLAGIVSVNYSAIIGLFSQPSLEKSLEKSIRQARHLASLYKDEVYLSYDEGESVFIIKDREKVLSKIESGFSSGGETSSIEFRRIIPRKKINDSDWKWENSEEILTEIVFPPYKASVPFLVIINSPNEDNVVKVFDPFSSFEMNSEWAPEL